MAGIGPCPLAGMLLADHGADVLVIDRAPDAGRKHRTLARQATSLLDLKHPMVVPSLAASSRRQMPSSRASAPA